MSIAVPVVKLDRPRVGHPFMYGNERMLQNQEQNGTLVLFRSFRNGNERGTEERKNECPTLERP